MKSGDIVKMVHWKENAFGEEKIEEYGLFIGLKTSGGYEYAEVMWFNRRAPNGDAISSIQKNLIEVVK